MHFHPNIKPEILNDNLILNTSKGEKVCILKLPKGKEKESLIPGILRNIIIRKKLKVLLSIHLIILYLHLLYFSDY